MRLATRTIIFSLGACGTAAAQNLPTPSTAAALRVPIHEAPADVGGAYGVWAAGPDFKASFHDGFVFYPVLGRHAPRNLPLRWTTVSVAVGETELASDAAEGVRAGDWRFEYRRGAVTEAYDVRLDGVEQTFVLHAPVAGGGDLVVRGRIDTPLAAAPLEATHAALTYADAEGRPVVRYGAALAVDAAGASREMTTSWDGGVVSLRLDAKWLADAAFPVTVDPLVGSAVLSLGSDALGEPSIETGVGLNHMVVTYVRYASATDADLFVREMGIDWSSPATIYTDVTANWTTPRADVAYCRGPYKWVVAMERGFPTAQASLIREHVHTVGDRTLDTTYGIVTSNQAEQCTVPSIGGANTADSEVLIAYQLDRGGYGTDTSNSEVWGTVRDIATRKNVTSLELGSRTAGFDAEWPDVAPLRGVDDPWHVVLQEKEDIPGGRYRARVTRVTPAGTLRGPFTVSDQSYLHWVRPRIAGGFYGEFMVTAACGGLQTTVYHKESGFYVRATRVHWPANSSSPAKDPSVVVHGVYSGPQTVHNLALAHDYNTRSHWAVLTVDTNTGEGRATRLGYWSGVAETATLPAGTSHAAAVYSGGRRSFPIAHVAGTNLLGTEFAYPTLRNPNYYQQGCGNGTARIWSSHSTAPHSGSNNFGIEISRVPSGASAILFLSTGRANLPLDGFGMTGCTLAVDLTAPNLVVPFDIVGTGKVVEIPLRAPIAGTFFAQFAYVNPNANALGLEMTDAVEFEVR